MRILVDTNILVRSVQRGHPFADRMLSRIETFFTLLPDSIEAFTQWRHLIVEHEVKGAKVHDARLVAVMHAYGLTQLLTFNVADFKRYPAIDAVHPDSIADS